MLSIHIINCIGISRPDEQSFFPIVNTSSTRMFPALVISTSPVASRSSSLKQTTATSALLSVSFAKFPTPGR